MGDDEPPKILTSETVARTIAAWSAAPENTERHSLAAKVARSIAGEEKRRAEHKVLIADVNAAVLAGKQAERMVEENRHRELVEAVEQAGRPSWRRDVIVLVLGAILGAIGTVLASLVTG